MIHQRTYHKTIILGVSVLVMMGIVFLLVYKKKRIFTIKKGSALYLHKKYATAVYIAFMNRYSIFYFRNYVTEFFSKFYSYFFDYKAYFINKLISSILSTLYLNFLKQNL